MTNRTSKQKRKYTCETGVGNAILFWSGTKISGHHVPRIEEVLTPDALAFVCNMHRMFEGRRRELLQQGADWQAKIDAGASRGFLPETKRIREDPSWRVADAPADLEDRRVEITGPVDRKMMINALNSGARVFMADFEDANSPTLGQHRHRPDQPSRCRGPYDHVHLA